MSESNICEPGNFAFTCIVCKKTYQLTPGMVATAKAGEHYTHTQTPAAEYLPYNYYLKQGGPNCHDCYKVAEEAGEKAKANAMAEVVRAARQ